MEFGTYHISDQQMLRQVRMRRLPRAFADRMHIVLMLMKAQTKIEVPEGLRGAEDMDFFLFSWSWGALVIILGELGTMHILLEN